MTAPRSKRQFPWRTIAMNLATCVVAMAGFWLMEGREYATRAEVRLIVSEATEETLTPEQVTSIVKRDSPYNEDRAMILRQLTKNTDVTESLTEAVTALRVTIARLDERLRPGSENYQATRKE